MISENLMVIGIVMAAVAAIARIWVPFPRQGASTREIAKYDRIGDRLALFLGLPGIILFLVGMSMALLHDFSSLR